MADKKISQLTALSAANLAPSTDVLAIVDTSATETKKIVAQDLINGVLNVASAVGIGTASPSYKLDVNNGGGSVAGLRVSGNDQANVRMRLENSGSGGRTWELVGGLPGANNANFSIRDVTGSTTPLTIDSSGNLGIGTASPAAKLHVAGSTGEAIIQDSDTAKGSNPAALLSLWGSDARAGYVGYPGDSNMYINQINNNAMLFLTNNTERGRFTAGGNFLVGTTSDNGSASNIVRVNGGIFSTYNATPSIAHNTATTVATLPSGEGIFLVSASLQGSGTASDWNELAVVRTSGSSSAITTLVGAVNLDITLSGLNVQITQRQGATQTIPVNIVRIL